jgi:3'(2'), 5'-bisphosphate nucleotidase
MTTLPTRDRDALLEAVLSLALRAGQAILTIYAGDFAVRAKADRSPVTDADEAAETIIVSGLAMLTPNWPVVAEERVARGETWGLAPALSGQPFWLVDPLDGTKEFVHRRDEFSVNIALIENAKPTLGVLHAPVTGVSYATAGADRVLRIDAQGNRQPITARFPGDGLEVLTSRSHGSAADAAWLAGVAVKRVTATGSALKFARIAEGLADAYPRFGPTSEWDTAAGQAILVAAGGSVRAPDGAALTYGKPDFRNSGFIARGRERSG